MDNDPDDLFFTKCKYLGSLIFNDSRKVNPCRVPVTNPLQVWPKCRKPIFQRLQRFRTVKYSWTFGTSCQDVLVESATKLISDGCVTGITESLLFLIL